MINKDNILSLVRTILTAFSAFIVGKHLFGQIIDDTAWQEWIALIVGLGSTVWGVLDKSATIESVQSFLRSTVIFVGGLLAAKGVLTADQVNSIMGIALAIVPYLYSILSKVKTAKISNGSLSVSKLKGS